MVKSHLDSCCTVWTPYKKGDIEALEKVQKRASEMLRALKNLPYSERLKARNLSTLHYRRIRRDMIEAYKIITGKYDLLVYPNMTTVRMSPEEMICGFRKIGVNRIYGNIVIHNRFVNTWNSLPNYVVSVNTTNMTFKPKFTEPKIAVCCNLKLYCIYVMMRIILNLPEEAGLCPLIISTSTSIRHNKCKKTAVNTLVKKVTLPASH